MIHSIPYHHILMPGGAGFIGANLCNHFVREGIKVTCIDNLSTGSIDNLSNLLSNDMFRFINADIRDGIPCYLNMDIDCIINLAGIASPKSYYTMPIEALLTSVVGVHKLLEFATKNNIPMLHASTSEVYGDPIHDELSEEYNGNVSCTGLRACYDEGKRAAETLCMDFNRINGTDVRIIRIFNTYGPFMRAHDGRAIPEFITNALHNNELCINGSGEQTRSFMYIDDLISAIQSYLSMPNAGIGPINIGNPNEEHSIAELAKLIITLTGSKSSVVNHDSLADDPKKRRPNIKKARNLLKWEPTIGLQQGLLKTIEYFRNND